MPNSNNYLSVANPSFTSQAGCSILATQLIYMRLPTTFTSLTRIDEVSTKMSTMVIGQLLKTKNEKLKRAETRKFIGTNGQLTQVDVEGQMLLVW